MRGSACRVDPRLAAQRRAWEAQVPPLMDAGYRIAFLEGFTTNFFAAGGKTDLVSEPFRRYTRDIGAFASPKGTLECIAAFGRTDFRG
jgi:hypothetical protein